MEPDWVAATLASCEMSPEETGRVLGAGDPEVVRRHLELHVEWLEERLARRRRLLALVEHALRRPSAA
jgi:hypothetical protein